MTENIRVLIVDDHAIVRKGLIAMLAAKPGVEVVGEAVDGNDALEKACTLLPDVILLDMVMPHKDGIATIKAIKTYDLPCKILVLTSFSSKDQVLGAIKAGADGYQLKGSAPSDLFQSIQDVYAGKTTFDPSINNVLASGLRFSEPQVDPKIAALTEQEMVVLKLLAEGLSDQEIAQKINVVPRTASTHVSHILDKLGVDNRTKAALYALKVGLVDLNDLNIS